MKNLKEIIFISKKIDIEILDKHYTINPVKIRLTKRHLFSIGIVLLCALSFSFRLLIKKDVDNVVKSSVIEQPTISSYEPVSFLDDKHSLIYDCLITSGASQLSEVEDTLLLKLVHNISESFKSKVLKTNDKLSDFFVRPDISVIETALIEQIKFDIPASVKLAQAIVETGWGKHYKRNNFFGIKGNDCQVKTTEYLTDDELKTFKGKIIRVIRKVGSRNYVECIDSFAGYNSIWESFRAHSLFLKKNKRYYTLFANGSSNYKEWTKLLNPSYAGGTGYSTSTSYETTLNSVIESYKLYELDF